MSILNVLDLVMNLPSSYEAMIEYQQQRKLELVSSIGELWSNFDTCKRAFYQGDLEKIKAIRPSLFMICSSFIYINQDDSSSFLTSLFDYLETLPCEQINEINMDALLALRYLKGPILRRGYLFFSKTCRFSCLLFMSFKRHQPRLPGPWNVNLVYVCFLIAMQHKNEQTNEELKSFMSTCEEQRLFMVRVWLLLLIHRRCNDVLLGDLLDKYTKTGPKDNAWFTRVFECVDPQPSRALIDAFVQQGYTLDRFPTHVPDCVRYSINDRRLVMLLLASEILPPGVVRSHVFTFLA